MPAEPGAGPDEGPVVGCVLVAGGSGTRLGLGIPKALADAGAATLLEVAVAGVAAPDPATGRRTVQHVVVVVPAASIEVCRRLVQAAWVRAGGPGEAVVVAGGADRQASVAAGLDALDPRADVVLVHDAARALTPPSVLAAVAGAVRGDVVAVVPGLTPADTVKRLAPPGDAAHDGLRAVAETLDRSALVAVQTPQGFRVDVLRSLHSTGPDRTGPDRTGPDRTGPDRTGEDGGRTGATDDAGMAEAAGLTVLVVPGHPEAFKVTTPLDLVLARALLQQRTAGQDGARDR